MKIVEEAAYREKGFNMVSTGFIGMINDDTGSVE